MMKGGEWKDMVRWKEWINGSNIFRRESNKNWAPNEVAWNIDRFRWNCWMIYGDNDEYTLETQSPIKCGIHLKYFNCHPLKNMNCILQTQQAPKRCGRATKKKSRATRQRVGAQIWNDTRRSSVTTSWNSFSVGFAATVAMFVDDGLISIFPINEIYCEPFRGSCEWKQQTETQQRNQ